jgi:hypothetical protein
MTGLLAANGLGLLLTGPAAAVAEVVSGPVGDQHFLVPPDCVVTPR